MENENRPEEKEREAPGKEKARGALRWPLLWASVALFALPASAYLAGWRLEVKRDSKGGEAIGQLYQKVIPGRLLKWAGRETAGEEQEDPFRGGAPTGAAAPVPPGSSPGQALEDSPDRPLDHVAVEVPLERRQLIGVSSEEVRRRPLEKLLRTVGRVEIDETRVSDIHTRVSGWVQKVFVDFTWQHVRRGDPLLTIYSPDLLSTQQEYLLALKGRERLGQSPFQEISAGADSLLEATRQRLLLWNVTEEQVREIERTRQVKRELTVYSPVTGHVTDRQVFPQQYVTPDTKLYQIVDHSVVWVNADIYEQEIPFVRIGQRASMTVDAYPGEAFWGKVSYIVPHLEMETRTLKVRLEFPNPQLRLKPGMYAHMELKVPLGERLALPQSALLDTGTRQLVFIDRGEGRFEPRDVKIGSEVDGHYELLQGVKAGEKVLTSASFLIDSESQLQAALGGIALSGMVTGTVGPKGKEPVLSLSKEKAGGEKGPAPEKLRIEFRSEPDPPKTGENTFQVKLADPSGKPIPDAEVSVVFYMPAMPSMGMPAMRTETKLKSAGGGQYRGAGQVVMGGAWEVTVTAQKGGQLLGSARFRVNAK